MNVIVIGGVFEG